MNNETLLSLLADDLGTEVDSMLEESVYDSVAPGICTRCRAVTDCCEPDARDNWCNECHGNHVKSALVLAGCI